MEVRFTAEQEARLSRIASHNGIQATELVKDAARGHDLYRITAFIRRDKSRAARDVAKTIYDGCESLVNLPNRGRMGAEPGTPRAGLYSLALYRGLPRHGNRHRNSADLAWRSDQTLRQGQGDLARPLFHLLMTLPSVLEDISRNDPVPMPLSISQGQQDVEHCGRENRMFSSSQPPTPIPNPAREASEAGLTG